MKQFITFCLLACGAPAAGLAQAGDAPQPCPPTTIATTPQQQAILREYIQDCRRKHFFFDDKGIVNLVVYQDANGATRWQLSTLVDDRYLAAPPEQYAYADNDVILVYKGDSTGGVLPAAGDRAARNLCLQEVIGSRVYERTTKGQFVYRPDASGTIKKMPVTRVSYGNGNNGLIIIFNKDGTISKMTPV